MARIIAGVTSSHVPAIGAAIDLKKTEEPYWKRVFSGFEKSTNASFVNSGRLIVVSAVAISLSWTARNTSLSRPFYVAFARLDNRPGGSPQG